MAADPRSPDAASVARKCRRLRCRQDLPPWSRSLYAEPSGGLCEKHEYAALYSRRRALGLIVRKREVSEDGSNHRWLYLAKAVVLVAIFPQRSLDYPLNEVIVATCDYHPFPSDFGGSWHEVAIGWGWRPRSWRWEWRGESS